MEKEEKIKLTIKRLKLLPQDKIGMVDDFVEFLLVKYKEEIELQKGIEKLVEKSDAFDFLHQDEDLYSVNDCKTIYK